VVSVVLVVMMYSLSGRWLHRKHTSAQMMCKHSVLHPIVEAVCVCGTIQLPANPGPNTKDFAVRMWFIVVNRCARFHHFGARAPGGIV
jgi:hypothetical protein